MSNLEDEILAETKMVAGDKGIFLSDGTDGEYEEYDRLENKGWKGFYKRVKNLGKEDVETN